MATGVQNIDGCYWKAVITANVVEGEIKPEASSVLALHFAAYVRIKYGYKILSCGWKLFHIVRNLGRA